MSSARYSIGELAAAAGVSRRTVRHDVQRGLLPSPLGLGRGRHSSDARLDAIRRIKAWPQRGATLDEMRRVLRDGGGIPGTGAPVAAAAAPRRLRAPHRRRLRPPRRSAPHGGMIVSLHA